MTLPVSLDAAPAVWTSTRGWRTALVVRGMWLVTAAIALGLHLVATPRLAAHISAETSADIANHGLTNELYAGWLGLAGLLLAVVFAAAGGLLIWHRPHERMAQFAAFTLLLFGARQSAGRLTIG